MLKETRISETIFRAAVPTDITPDTIARSHPRWGPSCLWLDVEFAPEQRPSFGDVVFRPGELESIHIDDQNEFEHSMHVQRWPFRANTSESNSLDVLIAVLLPDDPLSGCPYNAFVSLTTGFSPASIFCRGVVPPSASAPSVHPRRVSLGHLLRLHVQCAEWCQGRNLHNPPVWRLPWLPVQSPVPATPPLHSFD